MTLYQKSVAVIRLFTVLDREIQVFAQNTQLSCLSNCGFCCTKPNVQATVLEFLPYAMHCYLNASAEAAWETLSSRSEPICHLFSVGKLKGGCSHYEKRGLTCRLFGYSARKAKLDQLQLYTCDLIKTQKAGDYQKTVAYLNSKGKIPVVSEFYQKLKNIDPVLGKEMLPINEAQLKALELVLQYYSYRKPPRIKKVA